MHACKPDTVLLLFDWTSKKSKKYFSSVSSYFRIKNVLGMCLGWPELAVEEEE
jgi:hypothetical protein